MKKLLFPAALIALFFTACQDNQNTTMDENTIQMKVDSTVGERQDEIIQEADEDLERRLAIEVKPKADSIIEARTAAN